MSSRVMILKNSVIGVARIRVSVALLNCNGDMFTRSISLLQGLPEGEVPV